jgi:hypothetical protein
MIIYWGRVVVNSYRIIFVFLMTLALVFLASCSDNSSSPGSNSIPTMENIWPHADGSRWQYAATYSERFASVSTVTKGLPYVPLPSMAELHALMQVPLTGEPTLSGMGTYELVLDGEVTTLSGVVAQNVQETMSLDLSPKAGLPQVEGPIFISGYAFAFEDSGYYGYGDFTQDHSFIYLDKSLDVGTEFSIQLSRGLANDIWLNGQIWSRGTLRVGSKTYPNVIECLYVIDLGEVDLVNESGEVIGTSHDYIYAITHYAPGVGPIQGRERHHVSRDDSIQTSGPARIIEYKLDLTNY